MPTSNLLANRENKYSVNQEKKNLVENKVKQLLSKRSHELIYTQTEKPSAWKEQDFLVSYKIPAIDNQDVACGN